LDGLNSFSVLKGETRSENEWHPTIRLSGRSRSLVVMLATKSEEGYREMLDRTRSSAILGVGPLKPIFQLIMSGRLSTPSSFAMGMKEK